MAHKAINIHTKRLSQLVDCIDEGRFAIPRLQREFVWDGPKAAKLFDSMLRHLPIGVIMVWETPRSQRLHLRQKYHVLPPFNPRNPRVWFLIDGQQRISVVHRVRDGGTVRNSNRKDVKFGHVVFCLDQQEDGQQIRYRKPSPGCYEPLAAVLAPNWHRRLSHLGKRHKERVRKCRERLLRYPMHIMFVQADLEDVKESFLRINTQGMRITTADRIITGAQDLELRDFRHEVRQYLEDGFGKIAEMPILFAMAAIRGDADVEARGQALQRIIHRLEQDASNSDRLRKALCRDWHRLSVCFGKAVGYLGETFKVLRRDYLYSDYMVAILAAFYYWNGRGPSAKQREQIRRWFWATTVGSRYSGSNFLRCLPADLKFFRQLAKNPNRKFFYKPEIDRVDVRKGQYGGRTGITSACYCMLLQRRPVSIMDDGVNDIPLERYATLANRRDRHHIFPRQVLRNLEVPPKLYNSICNICLLTTDENKDISNRRPRSYLGDVKRNGTYFNRKMARHLVPVGDDSGIWLRDVKKGFMRFLKQRTELICDELEREAGIRLFRRDL